MRFCNSDDFTVSNINNNKTLTMTNSKGFDVALFYSTQCQHCKNFIDIFKDASGRTANCEFTLVNLDKNKDLIHKCKGTTTEIEFVPTTIFFAENKPYMTYGGPANTSKFLDFIKEVSNHYIKNRSNDNDNNTDRRQYSGINRQKPIGDNQNSPPQDACDLNDKECQIRSRRKMTCYLTLEEAYKKDV
jgi:thioredoxin-like negative regulator of GroEL